MQSINASLCIPSSHILYLFLLFIFYFFYFFCRFSNIVSEIPPHYTFSSIHIYMYEQIKLTKGKKISNKVVTSKQISTPQFLLSAKL